MSGIFNSAIFNNVVFNTTPTSTYGRSGLGGDDVPRRVTKSPHKGWDREAYERRRAVDDSVVETLKATYANLTSEDAPAAILAQADAIVRPHSTQARRDAPLVIDWQAIAESGKRTKALLRLWDEEQALRRAIADDDDLLIMMH